jgi:hypothetical protein
MTHRRADEVPEAIVQLQVRLDQWRSAQKGRTTAHTLRLDYTRLNKRLGNSVAPRQKPPQTAFVELVTHTADLQECVIEFESAGQAKMRIQWKSSVPPDWKELLRAWREVEG